MLSRLEMIDRIDTIADVQRAKIVTDPVRAFEYQVAEREARLFSDNQYIGEVPLTVKSWADANSWSAEDAARDILQEANSFNHALYFIRDQRLVSKSKVRSALTEDDAYAIYINAITALKSITP